MMSCKSAQFYPYAPSHYVLGAGDLNDFNASSSNAIATSSFECSSSFFSWPFFGPLVLENRSSDARDHCANERSKFPTY